jgi:hypothetical protein
MQKVEYKGLQEIINGTGQGYTLTKDRFKELPIKNMWIHKFVPFHEEYGKDERITKEVDDEWNFLVEEFKKLFQIDS